jgi:protein O-GlcNAc transferase
VRRGFSSGRTARKIGKRERNRFTPPKPQAKMVTDVLSVMEEIALAQKLYDAGDWDAAEPVIRRFLHRQDFIQPLTFDALGSCAQFQGRMDVAIDCFRKALEIDPDYAEARNRIIMIRDALPQTTAAQAQHEREKWWRQHGAHLYAKRRPHTNNRDPERMLRVGYVSGDFQYHSAATVFYRIALHHGDGFAPYFYSSTPYNKYDSITNTFRMSLGWRDIVDWPDALVVDKIRTDEIDILVDLSGYTAHNRLPVFCAKPAPIQITGWGYATGVGWPAMDYLISDRVVIPEDRQAEHVEKILYLPSVIDYEPVEGLPEANPLPCLTERPTFGVFQRSLKINADDVDVWRQILERLPESRLIMKGQYCPSLLAWIKDRFGAQVGQVEFQPVTSSFEHKVAYSQVDLNLDTWPQTAGVSACDALWQGVPAVTLIGDRVIQRTTASLLTILGMTDFIATTREEYIDKAVAWVTVRKTELAEVRRGLKAKCDASPIRQGYKDATEDAFRRIWRDWCAKPMSIADARYRLEQAS